MRNVLTINSSCIIAADLPIYRQALRDEFSGELKIRSVKHCSGEKCPVYLIETSLGETALINGVFLDAIPAITQ